MIKAPTQFTAKVLNVLKINPKDIRVEFESLNLDFTFAPGQFVNIKASENSYRSYSVCSSQRSLPRFSLVVEIAHEGIGSNFFRGLKAGDEVTVIGPSGKLTLPETLPSSLYFFATGTGVAPFISIFYKLVELNYSGKVTLFFGVRYETEKLFSRELNGFKNSLEGFDYKLCVSQPRDHNVQSNRVTSEVPNMKDYSALYFLCGHPQMVLDVQQGLISNGIPQENVIKEEFTRKA